MKDDTRDRHWMLRWGLPASVVVHSLVAALLIFGLPVSLLLPQDEAISVELVPPPEPPEKAKAEPPPPAQEPEKPQQSKAEKPSGDAPRQEPAPAPALRPVFQFGEKDAGPREAKKGNSAEESQESRTTQQEPDKPDVAEEAVTALEAKSQGPQPAAAETPSPKPADAAKKQAAAELQKAETLFSQTATGGPMATIEMGSLPRGVRAGQLCVTALNDQLLNASPPYFPERLPFDRLKDGTVIEILNTAFRAGGQWYNVSYRCEVDEDAMKVVSFAFRVGDPVPRGEWKRRGLPLQ